MQKLTPQPQDYGREQRKLQQDGLTWVFEPSNYFQWYHLFGFEDDVLDVLTALGRNAEAFLDVGANVGYYSLMVAKHAGVPSIGVEPHPKTFGHFCKHIELNSGSVDVRAVQSAVGDADGVAHLKDFGVGDVGKFSLREGEENSIEVPVTTIDKILDSTSVGLIKIDIEGFEPEALLGAQKTLASLPTLCLEYSPDWYANKRDYAKSAFQGLVDMGYQAFDNLAFRQQGARAPIVDLVAILELPERFLTQRNVVLIHKSKVEASHNAMMRYVKA